VVVVRRSTSGRFVMVPFLPTADHGRLPADATLIVCSIRVRSMPVVETEREDRRGLGTLSSVGGGSKFVLPI